MGLSSISAPKGTKFPCGLGRQRTRQACSTLGEDVSGRGGSWLSSRGEGEMRLAWPARETSGIPPAVSPFCLTNMYKGFGIEISNYFYQNCYLLH